VTVKELIDELGRFDLNSIVYIINDSEWGTEAYPLSSKEFTVINGNLVLGASSSNDDIRLHK
jgi:hypothetical protein